MQAQLPCARCIARRRESRGAPASQSQHQRQCSLHPLSSPHRHRILSNLAGRSHPTPLADNAPCQGAHCTAARQQRQKPECVCEGCWSTLRVPVCRPRRSLVFGMASHAQLGLDSAREEEELEAAIDFEIERVGCTRQGGGRVTQRLRVSDMPAACVLCVRCLGADDGDDRYCSRLDGAARRDGLETGRDLGAAELLHRSVVRFSAQWWSKHRTRRISSAFVHGGNLDRVDFRARRLCAGRCAQAARVVQIPCHTMLR